jgi:hypothetical protein
VKYGIQFDVALGEAISWRRKWTAAMWKANWEETKQHFIDWWNHEGMLLGMWGDVPSDSPPHEEAETPPEPASVRDFYMDGELRARWNHYRLTRRAFPADVLPVSETHIGPGSLALLLGSEPEFYEGTVWFKPCIHECVEPERLPPFKFDVSNKWGRITETTLRACANRAKGKYLVGHPDLIENVDILASLRGSQKLLIDMIEKPEWVEQKVAEINQVWFEAYRRIYDIARLEDGASTFGYFRIWGPGRIAKLQCDASAMFSPAMFERFVLPGLTEQCEWLDYSMYHLDGTQALCHLDSLLGIDSLDAVEWTPQDGIEGGGNPRWFEMYRRVLDAGKSLQVVGVHRDEILPFLDAIGGRGVYIMTSFSSVSDAEEVMAMVEPYR